MMKESQNGPIEGLSAEIKPEADEEDETFKQTTSLYTILKYSLPKRIFAPPNIRASKL